MSVYIVIPETAVPCTAQQAFRYLRSGGSRIMATLTGKDGVYAARGFSPFMIEEEMDRDDQYQVELLELSEYIADGQWYLLEADESAISEVADFINVYLVGGLVNHVAHFDTQEAAAAHMKDRYEVGDPFDPEIEDATTWKRNSNGVYENIYTHDLPEGE